ncbi:unnamed protein product [Auanema sp. JU1783]|nr:unnamed protein product [Auanema sp. JU1783]
MTLAPAQQLNVGSLDMYKNMSSSFFLASKSGQTLSNAQENNSGERYHSSTNDSRDHVSLMRSVNGISPVSSVISNCDLINCTRKPSKKLLLRKSTISIGEGERILIDHVTARWEGNQMNQQPSILDGDDVTVLTDTVKGEEESAEEPKNCLQQTVKYIKILIPHIILVAVLIGYLCLGAWILMLLETRTELLARSRKLVR